MGFRKLFARHFWIIQHLKDFPAILGGSCFRFSFCSRKRSPWIEFRPARHQLHDATFVHQNFRSLRCPQCRPRDFQIANLKTKTRGNFTKTLKDPTDCSLELFPDSKSEEESYQPITGWVNASQLVPSMPLTNPGNAESLAQWPSTTILYSDGSWYGLATK